MKISRRFLALVALLAFPQALATGIDGLYMLSEAVRAVEASSSSSAARAAHDGLTLGSPHRTPPVAVPSHGETSSSIIPQEMLTSGRPRRNHGKRRIWSEEGSGSEGERSMEKSPMRIEGAKRQKVDAAPATLTTGRAGEGSTPQASGQGKAQRDTELGIGISEEERRKRGKALIQQRYWHSLPAEKKRAMLDRQVEKNRLRREKLKVFKLKKKAELEAGGPAALEGQYTPARDSRAKPGEAGAKIFMPIPKGLEYTPVWARASYKNAEEKRLGKLKRTAENRDRDRYWRRMMAEEERQSSHASASSSSSPAPFKDWSVKKPRSGPNSSPAPNPTD